VIAGDDRVPPGPQLVWVVDPPDLDRRLGATLSFSALDPADPLAELYGQVTPPEVVAVGFVADARGHRIGRRTTSHGSRDGRIVHLQHRDGTEVRSLPGGPRHPPTVLAPTRERSVAPIGDVCRCMLGLPTAAPPTHTIDWWVDGWVEDVLVLALREGGASWQDASGLSGAPLPATPAEVASWLVTCGHHLSWSDLHRDQIALAHHHAADPDSPLPRAPWPFDQAATLEWMDVGAFARARWGTQPPIDALLDTLATLLRPTVADQVRATVTLALGEARASTEQPRPE
jgi:hypothetical protein